MATLIGVPIFMKYTNPFNCLAIIFWEAKVGHLDLKERFTLRNKWWIPFLHRG